MKQYNNQIEKEYCVDEEDYSLYNLESKLSSGCWDDEIEEEFGIKFDGDGYDQ